MLAMARRKVRLAFISSDSMRRATLKKRKNSLKKKITELNTLCDVEACAIIYNPEDPTTPLDVWPSQEGVQRVLSEFETMQGRDQKKKVVDQPGYLKQRIEKADEHMKKQMKENRENQMTELMFDCVGGFKSVGDVGSADMSDMELVVDQYIKDIDKKMNVSMDDDIAVGGSMEPWYSYLLKPQGRSPTGFEMEDSVVPFGDTNPNPLWSP